MKVLAAVVLALAFFFSLIIENDAFIGGSDLPSTSLTGSGFESMVQMRSKTYYEKLNSSGIIVSDRWVVGVAKAIHDVSVVLIYTGTCVFNGLDNVYHVSQRSANNSDLRMVKANRTITLSATLKLATLPTGAETFTSATFSSYGPKDATSNWCRVRQIKEGFQVKPVNDPLWASQGPLPANIIAFDNAVVDPTAVTPAKVCTDVRDYGGVFITPMPNSVVIALHLDCWDGVPCNSNPVQEPVVWAARLSFYVSWINQVKVL